MAKITKRFIAGAVCPKCAAMDRLVTYRKDDDEYRECVECGYSEKMHFKPRSQELTTRVNKSEEDIENETQVLSFDPKGHK